MAESRKQKYDRYKSRGGTKTFAEYSARASAQMRKSAAKPKNKASVKKKVGAARKMVSGKFRTKLRKDIKTKYSI